MPKAPILVPVVEPTRSPDASVRSAFGRSAFGRSTFGRSTFGRSTFGRSTFGRSALGCVLALLSGLGCSRGEAAGGENPHASSAPNSASSAPGSTSSAPPARAFARPAPGSGAHLGVNFWNVDWDPGNVFVEGANFAQTNDPFRPELVAALAPFSVLRFMDWNGTNRPQNPQAHASTRKKKTEQQNELVAFEWQIELCNRARSDLWLTVPHEATPSDWEDLARLVHTGLDPSLRVYLEWSNEVWNAAFPQHQFAAGAAAAEGLTGELPAQRYAVWAATRLFEVFERVFGEEQGRLVRVLAGQAEWAGPCEAQRSALGDRRVNPRGAAPDVYAIAPYAHGTSLAALRAALPNVKRGAQENLACAKKMGAPLVAYEAGVDAFALGSGCRDFQRDPGLRQFYGEYLDALTSAGLTGPILHYTHTGACWGLREKLTDPVERSPKLSGVLDWLAKQSK